MVKESVHTRVLTNALKHVMRNPLKKKTYDTHDFGHRTNKKK